MTQTVQKNLALKVILGLSILVLLLVILGWILVTRFADSYDAVEEVAALPELAPLTDTVSQNAWIDWREGEVTPDFYVAGMNIRIDAAVDDGLNLAVMTVTAPDGNAVTIRGEATSKAAASFAVVQMDAASEARQILFSSFSGGAHCCTQAYMLEYTTNGWRTVDLGAWDGDVLALPQDLDGDGKKEFLLSDQRFLYAFSSYADSVSPPAIYAVQNGHFTDVSKEAKYRPAFERELNRMKSYCQQGSNGGCAGYVATAARVGKLEEAWRVMLASYSKDNSWTFPAPCKVTTTEDCPENEMSIFETYPESLQWFLGEAGYTDAVYTPWANPNGPSFSCAAARTNVERMICGHPDLKRIDMMMSVAYTRAHALSPDRAALRAAQADFLRERNAATDEQGIWDVYVRRLELLKSV